MDIKLRQMILEKAGKRHLAECLHVPAQMSVGLPKDAEDRIAVVSARWLKDKWTNEHTFKTKTGFPPSTSRSSMREVMKAASGNVFTVDNVPTEGFKLSLEECTSSMKLSDSWKSYAISECGAQLRSFKAGRTIVQDPQLVVEDPRGWKIPISAAAAFKLIASRSKQLDAMALPGPLVYVFSENGFTLDFPDGKLASAALTDSAIDSLARKREALVKAASPVIGCAYENASLHERLLYIGKAPASCELLPHSSTYKALVKLDRVVTDAVCLHRLFSDQSKGASSLSMYESSFVKVISSLISTATKDTRLHVQTFLPWKDDEYASFMAKTKALLESEKTVDTFVFLDGENMFSAADDCMLNIAASYSRALYSRDVDNILRKRITDKPENYDYWSNNALFVPYSYYVKQTGQREASLISLLPQSSDCSFKAYRAILKKRSKAEMPLQPIVQSDYAYYDYKAIAATADHNAMLEALQKCHEHNKKVYSVLEALFPPKDPGISAECWLKQADEMLASHLEWLGLLVEDGYYARKAMKTFEQIQLKINHIQQKGR